MKGTEKIRQVTDDNSKTKEKEKKAVTVKLPSLFESFCTTSAGLPLGDGSMVSNNRHPNLKTKKYCQKKMWAYTNSLQQISALTPLPRT